MRLAAGAALAALGAACAGPAPQAGHSFSEVRFHRAPLPPTPAYLQAEAPSASRAIPRARPAARDPDAAVGRVLSLLKTDGFTIEATREGPAWRLTATRMAAPAALRLEAACALKAMHRPDFSASDLEVRLADGAAGGAAETTGRFVLVDTNLISGELTRQKCRSNGVLEAAVRRAAAG